MPASILIAPDSPAFIRNPLTVTLETDKGTAQAAYIILELTNEDGPNEEDGLQFNYGGAYHSFVFTNTPTDPNHIPLKTTNQTPAEWWAATAEYFRQHNEVSNYFTITSPTPQQIRLSLNTPEAYDTVIGGTVQNITATAYNPQATAQVTNLSAWMSVVNANTQETIITKIGQYDPDTKQCLFSIADAFDHLTPHLPDPSKTTVTDAPSVAQLYYIRYADRYGSPPVTEPRMASGIFTALYGGLSSGNRKPYFLSGFQVLHNRIGLAKQVSTTQPDWLYIHSKINLRLYWDVQIELSNSSIIMYSMDEYFDLTPGTARYLRTGFKQIGLDTLTLPDETYIAFYTVRLRKDQTNEIYYNHRYQVEAQPQHPWNLYLLYDTGMGGMETVRLKGKRQALKFEIDNTIIEKNNGELSTIFSEGSEKTEVSTGFYPLDYLHQLRQLLLGDIYLIETPTNPNKPNDFKFHKIIADTKSFDTIPDDNDLHALVFSFKRAKKLTQFNSF